MAAMTAVAVPSFDLPIFIDIITSSMIQHGGIAAEARGTTPDGGDV
jgi:hypothetical protein